MLVKVGGYSPPTAYDERAISDTRFDVTAAHRSVIESLPGPWWQDLQADRWLSALGESIRELGLTPADVGRVLTAWDAQAGGLSAAKRLQAKRTGDLPPRSELWWRRWRPWIELALRGDSSEPEADAGAVAEYDPCEVRER